MSHSMPVPGHYPQIHLFSDPQTGVQGVVVIDSLALGPAAGGCRLWPYASTDAMVADAKRLAQGMSYKNAMAGLPFGGGKAVLNKPAGDFDRARHYRALGDAIETLGGTYITAEDVGTTLADMAVVRTRTKFVSGLEAKPDMAGGDPSDMTALGVFESLKAATARYLQRDLRETTVAIQGAGSVGSKLAHLLHAAGASLIVADLYPEKAQALAAEVGATVVGQDEILAQDADVFAPCALGAILSADTIPRLKARLICGAANNQLAVAKDGAALLERGIIYIPDYVVNAGGIINATAEFLEETVAQVRDRVAKIADRVLMVVDEAQRRDLPTNIVADEMAQRIIDEAAARR